jgi:hypothetical protein
MNAENGPPTTNGLSEGPRFARREKATTVVFWKFANGTAETQDDGEEHSVSSSRLLFTRGYSVFNASQVDGYKHIGRRKWSLRSGDFGVKPLHPARSSRRG